MWQGSLMILDVECWSHRLGISWWLGSHLYKRKKRERVHWLLLSSSGNFLPLLFYALPLSNSILTMKLTTSHKVKHDLWWSSSLPIISVPSNFIENPILYRNQTLPSSINHHTTVNINWPLHSKVTINLLNTLTFHHPHTPRHTHTDTLHTPHSFTQLEPISWSNLQTHLMTKRSIYKQLVTYCSFLLFIKFCSYHA